MILFAVILLGICTISGVIVFWMELSITNDRLQWLEERLVKLEKDAVKITFTGEPHYHGIRTTREDVDKILNNKPLIEGKTKSQSKGDTGITQASPPPPPKVLGEWQIKNGNPLRKPNSKQFDGVKSEEPFVKTRKKRKPKTVAEWEEEVDLGGHE